MMAGVVEEAVRWFGGMPGRERRRELRASLVELPGAGEILLVTGGSGAGKTTLLRELAWWAGVQGCEVRWVRGVLGRGRVVEMFAGAGGAAEVMAALAGVGLAEAGLLFRRARELSEGERQRLGVAVALWEARRRPVRRERVLMMDEFAASLDVVTAMGVAGAVSRAVSREGARCRVSAVVATWRGDLAGMLGPTRWVRADYGRVVEVV